MDSRNLYAYIPFFCFLFTVIVTTYFQAKTRPSRLKHAYMMFSLALVFWIFCDLVLWLRIDESWYLPLLKIQSLFWIPVGALFMNFAYAYISLQSKYLLKLVTALAILATAVSVGTDWVIVGYRDVYWGVLHQAGPLHTYITNFVVTVPMFVGIMILLRRYLRSSDDMEKPQLLMLVVGTFTGSAVSFFTVVLFPDILHRTDVVPLHDVGIALHSLFTSIAVSRYRLMNVEIEDVADDMFARMHDGVVILDRHGRIQHANLAATEMLNLGEGGRNKGDIREFFVHYPDAHGFSNFELVPNGAEEGLIYSVSQAPSMSKEGETSSLVIIRDISEEKRTEAAIRKMNEELAKARDTALEASKLKSQFLANMSHELRTPLNAVIGYSEIIQEEADEAGIAQVSTDAEKINRAGRHLLSLINDILDLSKIEAGKMDVYIENFDVNAMLDDVLFTSQPLIDKNKNRLVSDIAPHLGMMHSDQIKIRQILLNLISNAAKFTTDGEIRIGGRRQRIAGVDHIVYEVADSGIGMTTEQLEKLYSAFTQADASTTRRYGGTGLGMAITRHFIDMLSGTIDVESEYGKGTKFSIRLPVVYQVEDEAASLASTISHAIPVVNLTEDIASAQIKVLVIDDDAPTRELIVRHLSREGMRVLEAGDGRQGLEIARAVRPDVITLDVMMPELDGWSVLNELKNDAQLASIPVIMLSMVDNQRLGYALGATEYLVKPVVQKNLIEVVTRVLREADDTNILVVDDDEDIRNLMSTLLSNLGMSVVTAANGREALDKVNLRTPSLILLDLVMPVMDGFEFLKHFRDVNKYRNVPVVVLSAADLTRELRQQLQTLVSDVVSKHIVSPQQLVADIRSMVGSNNS